MLMTFRERPMPDVTFCPQCNTRYPTAGMRAVRHLCCKKRLGVSVVSADASAQAPAVAEKERA